MGRRVAGWVLVAQMLACKTVTPVPSLELGVVPEPRAASPTWRRDQAWTRWAGVALDDGGRVAVVGQRLVAAAKEHEAPHAVGVVTVFEREGAIAWTTTIDGSWIEGVAIEPMREGGFVALLRAVESNADETKSLVVAWDADGSERWRVSVGDCLRARPHDLALDGDGRIAIVSGCDAPDEQVWPEPYSRLTVLDAEGKVSWTMPVTAGWSTAGDATSVAFRPEGRVHVGGWGVDGMWLLELDTRQQPPKPAEATEPDFVNLIDIVVLPGERVAVVGEPAWDDADDPEPVLVFDASGQPVWQGGEDVIDEVIAVRATPGGTLHVLDEAKVVSIEPRPGAAPEVQAFPIRDDERVTDLAIGPGGTMALIGARDGAAWGSTEGWVVRIDTPVDAWPVAPSVVETGSPARFDGDLARDARVASAVVHWIDPRGPKPELEAPPNDALRRSVALGLLSGAPRCRLVVGDTGPDYISYDPAEPGHHARFDDPCVRHALAVEHLESLRAADYDLVAPSLERLLVAYADTGSDRPVNPVLGEALLDFAFARGRGSALASVAFGHAEPEVQAYAVEKLLGEQTRAGNAALRSATEAAPCDVAMLAATELVRRDPTYEATTRPAGATAEELVDRLCMLRHHPDPKVYEAYWSTLLDGSGTYQNESACAGDWPEDSELWDGCTDDTTIGRAAPGPSSWSGARPECDDVSCSLGEQHLEENGPHGWSTTLVFERGTDGELYVETLTHLDWYGGY